ncbi:MAG: glucose-6-phosphate dehydrogenase [Actinomycetota bacterium]|nr:glucose-6-phosphate dehydrogenase [Actinomycetota bacterium]
MTGARRTPDPTAMVIFGASGDLTSRKLMPALFHLHHEGMLPDEFAVVGYARTRMTDEEFREDARRDVDKYGRCEPDGEVWDRFAAGLFYVSGDFDGPDPFAALRGRLADVDRMRGTDGRRFYYASVPPVAFPSIVRGLGAAGMAERSRIVIEKPFGTDLAGAVELNRVVHEVFDESQVFRIDHYLGKETVQNIVVFRFANTLFEPVWNRRYVDHVQLTVAEEIGIEGRGRFYERTGALRDMVQTHLLQVLTFLAMEPPPTFEPEGLRDEKVKVLRAIRPVRPEHVVRGQYEGYRDEAGVDPGSDVETFVAMRLEIDNWRWAGVPFFVRTGKRLAARRAEATIVFHDVPHLLFEREGARMTAPNRLVIRIQPEESISLSFTVRRPSLGLDLDQAGLEFDYRSAFSSPLVEAYELLLLEAMRGDHTLFTRQDEVERSWALLEPVMASPPPVRAYAPGWWGPDQADELIAPRSWHPGR